MLVSRSNFAEVVARISKPGKYGIDTETTGLHAYKTDRLYSIIVGQEHDAWYFNFNYYPKLDREYVLEDQHKKLLQDLVFSSPDHYWFAHNAKFDMAMLLNEGIWLSGTVHCTYALGRILRGDLFHYSLDALCERWLGVRKSDAVMDYMDKHKLYTEFLQPGKKVKKRNYFFHKVPLDVMQPYAELDTTLCYKLGMFQLDGFKKLDAAAVKGCPSLQNLVETELKLTKVLFDMERRGIQLDVDYCQKAMAYYLPKIDAAMAKFKELTGLELVDSALTFKKAFPDFSPPLTEKGRQSWADATLELINSPAAESVRNYREASKFANTYFRNYLDFMDDNGVIHPNYRQAGAKTGRLSCSDPNMQNLTKAGETENTAYQVRRSFIPRPGFCFFMPDFDQMEYRVMLDIAEEMGVIEKVLGGLDVHTATGEIMGVDRARAKTINFKLIYGGGDKSLATDLGITYEEAKALRAKYFEDLPKVGEFTKRVENAIYQRGYLFNYRGRRYIISPDAAYKGPNAIVQGSCADALRDCMVTIAQLLSTTKSHMLLQIHDELVFELHEDELWLAKKLQEIMEKAFPSKHLPLRCSPSYSWNNLQDQIDGYPSKEAKENAEREAIA